MSSQQNIAKLIRKLRKKLRQIENLERVNRCLTEEELHKLDLKDEVREKLQIVLEEYESADSADEGRLSTEGHTPHTLEAALGDKYLASGHVSHSPTDHVSHSTPEGGQGKKKSLQPRNESSSDKRSEGSHGEQGGQKKQKPKDTKSRPQLSESTCRIIFLEGHSDLVTSLVIVSDKLVTASRDTSLKCWDLTRHTELRSYGAHTECVTSLLVLDHTAAQPVLQQDDKLLVSGSYDSSFKLWSLNTGQMLRSVYTYNPVVQVAYCFPASRLVTGSDGGKLELWNLASGQNTFSSRDHNASITGLKVSDSTVYSCASDGIIRVHQVTESGHLACIFVSENVKTLSGDPLITRHIRCLAVCSDNICFGDDSRNVKVLNWKKGLVTKVPNHTDSFASTDALSCHHDLLLSSSFNLDEGLGYVNVYNSTTLEYQASLDDELTERIVCLDFGYSPSGNLFVVTGGMDLKLWEVQPARESKKRFEDADDDVINLQFQGALSQPAVDSEVESSQDDDGSDDEVEQILRQIQSRDSGGWSAWCNIL